MTVHLNGITIQWYSKLLTDNCKCVTFKTRLKMSFFQIPSCSHVVILLNSKAQIAEGEQKHYGLCLETGV